MPSRKRITFDNIKRRHKSALLMFINESTSSGISPRAISQAFRSLITETTTPPAKAETVKLSYRDYQTLVNNHKDVVDDLYSRMVLQHALEDSDGCVLSTASATSTRPKVAITKDNRAAVPFALPANFTQAVVALLKHDQVPSDEGSMEVSHRCHTCNCCKHSHLKWESTGDNAKRKQCAEVGKCVCGLLDMCIFC